MLFYFIFGTIMIAGLIGLIVCAKKQHSFKGAQILAAVFMILILSCGAIMLVHYNKSGDPNIIKTQNLQFQSAASFVLAEYIGKGLKDPQVIVLLDKSKNSDAFQKASMAGLEKGFEGTTSDIIYVTPSVIVPETNSQRKLGIMDIAKAKDLNFILAKYPKCKILISFIGLPKDLKDLSLVAKFQEDPEKAVRIGLLSHGEKKLYRFIKVGFISVAVTANPTKKYSEDTPTSDMKETFDKRFLLITPENIEQIAEKYPNRIFRKVRGK